MEAEEAAWRYVMENPRSRFAATSALVAQKHFLQATEADFEPAAFGG
jgi:hypothetical protein